MAVSGVILCDFGEMLAEPKRPAAIGQFGHAPAIIRGERGTWIDPSVPERDAVPAP